jgi:hypothetical protein
MKWIVCGLFLVLDAISVQAAVLNHVRIGVHKEFTRIVFELNKQALCEDPVQQGAGICSLKLLNTKSEFTSTIPGHAKAKVKSIELIKDESDLIALIRLSFPNFDASSFILPNPYRIVLDIRPKGPLTKDAPIQRQSFVKAKTAPERQDIPVSASEKNTIPESEAGKIDDPNVNRLEATFQETSPTLTGDPAGGDEDEAISRLKLPSETTQKTNTIYRISPDNPSPESDADRLQLYLLAVLALSTITLTLLCFLVLKRSRPSGKENREAIVFGEKVDKTLDLIDEKINEKIDELCQNLRFKDS